MSSRAEREAKGRKGETLAAWYLRFKGWRIIARRVKTPRGEVDLIARRGRTLAFIEVKWRASAAQLDFAVDPYRLRRVAAALPARADAQRRQCSAGVCGVVRRGGQAERGGTGVPRPGRPGVPAPGRGLARGRIFTRDGRLVASVMQEGLIRQRPSR